MMAGRRSTRPLGQIILEHIDVQTAFDMYEQRQDNNIEVGLNVSE